MTDFRKMTVDALRVLARKAVGKVHPRLETKRDLIEALEAAERKGSKASGKAPTRGRARQRSTVDTSMSTPKKDQRKSNGEKARAGSRRDQSTSAGKKSGVRPGKRAAAKLSEEPLVSDDAVDDAGLDPEGYFVARVRGEEEARLAPHPMTEGAMEDFKSAPPAPSMVSREADGAGELPWAYEDDALVAIPRDPRTLFLYWDFARSTLARGYEGMGEVHPQIWLFVRSGGDRHERIRTVEFGLEARCYYLHDLEPGRRYRAEVHLLDGRGNDRLLGSGSNEVELPSIGPSSAIDDRFARIPWETPLPRWMHQEHPGQPFSEESRTLLARLSDPSRFSGRVWGNSGGGRSSPGGEPSPSWESSPEKEGGRT